MTEALDVAPAHKVLEIGTGSGYQAAVLGELAREVYTIEIVPELARRAEGALRRCSIPTCTCARATAMPGWPEQAPFDRIIVTAAPEEIPQPLLDQLATGAVWSRRLAPRARPSGSPIVEKTRTGWSSAGRFRCSSSHSPVEQAPLTFPRRPRIRG